MGLPSGCVTSPASDDIEWLEALVATNTPAFRSLAAQLASEIGTVYSMEYTVAWEADDPAPAPDVFQIEMSGFLTEVGVGGVGVSVSVSVSVSVCLSVCV